jgi:hypothetical protein
MEVINTSRLSAKLWSRELDPDEWAWISINEPITNRHVVQDIVTNKFLNDLNNLKIDFWDVEYPIYPIKSIDPDGEILFPMTEDAVKKILDFLLDNSGKSIIINCAAGISRSGAICKFCENHLNYTWTKNKEFSDPNNYIYELLKKVYEKV